MQKYKIEYTQTETFIVDVLATSQEEAEEIANQAMQNGEYQEMGDAEMLQTNVFDVTNTEDPFFPINKEDTTLSTTNAQE